MLLFVSFILTEVLHSQLWIFRIFSCLLKLNGLERIVKIILHTEILRSVFRVLH